MYNQLHYNLAVHSLKITTKLFNIKKWKEALVELDDEMLRFASLLK